MRLLLKFTTLIPLLFLVLTPWDAQGNELTCPIQEIKISEKHTWRITDASCPEGRGLWKNAPTNEQGVFWVQCAYTQKLPDTWLLDLLGKLVPPQEIILRNEAGKYRCLLGPYTGFANASALRDKMREHKALNNAFVREVSSKVMVANKPPVPAPVVPKVDEPPMDDGASMSNTNDIPADDSMLKKKLMKREFHQIGELYSPVPMANDPNYSEGDKSWLRAPFDKASNICSESGLEIVSLGNLEATALDKSQNALLPKRLPYWVQDKVAFDIVMMVPISLTENSAIYVFCE